MDKIRLETADGALVAYVEILCFQDRPEVIIWGTRAFTFYEEDPDDSFQGLGGTLPRHVYREAFVVTSMTPPPGLSEEDRK